MVTGLFLNRSHNQGRSFAVYRAKQRRLATSTTDRFAECLAEGSDVHECAVKLGISYTWAETLFKRMRKALGKQAV